MVMEGITIVIKLVFTVSATEVKAVIITIIVIATRRLILARGWLARLVRRRGGGWNWLSSFLLFYGRIGGSYRR